MRKIFCFAALVLLVVGWILFVAGYPPTDALDHDGGPAFGNGLGSVEYSRWLYIGTIIFVLVIIGCIAVVPFVAQHARLAGALFVFFSVFWISTAGIYLTFLSWLSFPHGDCSSSGYPRQCNSVRVVALAMAFLIAGVGAGWGALHLEDAKEA